MTDTKRLPPPDAESDEIVLAHGETAVRFSKEGLTIQTNRKEQPE